MGSEELNKVRLSHMVQRSSVVSAVACSKAELYSISRQGTPCMEVLLGERKSDEENQETSAVISKCRNTGEKISPESAFLRLVNCASPASAFRQQAHSGTAGHVISPALPSYEYKQCCTCLRHYC
jgi:hypothetical protein